MVAVYRSSLADHRQRSPTGAADYLKNSNLSLGSFIKEDLNGTNPKFDVRDEDGVKWRVKLDAEARPEVVATRLVWAVGYSANEDYFLPELRVQEMPSRLHRGQNLVAPDGSMRNVRLKRHVKDEKKSATGDGARIRSKERVSLTGSV